MPQRLARSKVATKLSCIRAISINPAALQCSFIGWALLETLTIGGDVWQRFQGVEQRCNLNHKGELNIGARETVIDQPIHSLQGILYIAEMAL
mmetsp:Transcript_1868/g.4117  ORF Transcript_1868/g.4117 Transcript_1868/m.4117 type:complete len:93 (+) Transcript_1868:297-575(+)